MGEKLEEINLAKVCKENPEALQTLKRICSKFAHQFEILPCIVDELNYISEEEIPEEFMNTRIILSEDKNGDSLILANPEILKKFGKRYIKYSDISNKSTWVKKTQIALSDVTEPNQLLEKMAELDDTTVIQQRKEKIKENSGKVYRDSLKVGKKVVKGGKIVVEKAVIPAGKATAKATAQTTKRIIGFLDIIGSAEEK